MRGILDALGTRSIKLDLFLRRVRESLARNDSNYLNEFDAWMLRAQAGRDLGELVIALQGKASELVGGPQPPRRDDYTELRETADKIRIGTLGVLEKIRDIRDPGIFNVISASDVSAVRRRVTSVWLRLLESVDSLLVAIDSSTDRTPPRQADGGATSFVVAQTIYRAVLEERSAVALELDAALERTALLMDIPASPGRDT